MVFFVPRDWDDAAFKAYFESYGAVESAKVVMDKATAARTCSSRGAPRQHPPPTRTVPSTCPLLCDHQSRMTAPSSDKPLSQIHAQVRVY